MTAVYASTSPDWLEIIQTLPPASQVAFWQPTPAQPKNIRPGEYWYFKELGRPLIRGHGVFVGWEKTTISSLFRKFDIATGCRDKEALEAALKVFNKDVQANSIVGNVILNNVVFYDKPISLDDAGLKDLSARFSYVPDGANLDQAFLGELNPINADRKESVQSRQDVTQVSKIAYLRAYEVFDAAGAAARMAKTALHTTNHANGQVVSSVMKNKDLQFSSAVALQDYIVEIIGLQGSRCALTGLPLELDEVNGDSEMFASLDRIDSSGHYEKGNLQVVCRFANRWKGASDDADFKRLISLIRAVNQGLI